MTTKVLGRAGDLDEEFSRSDYYLLADIDDHDSVAVIHVCKEVTRFVVMDSDYVKSIKSAVEPDPEPEKSDSPFTQREWLDMINSLTSVYRFNTLIHLRNSGPQNRDQIVEGSGMKDKHFAHHMNILLQDGLVDYFDKHHWEEWEITDKGCLVLDTLFEKNEKKDTFPTELNKAD